MPVESPSPEFLVCAGAFASILVFKYLLSRDSEIHDAKLSSSPVPLEHSVWEGERSIEKNSQMCDGRIPDPSLSSGHETARDIESRKLNGDVYGSFSGVIPVIGLENLGNTCYLNSVIQAITCIPEFVHWMQRSRGTVCHRQESGSLFASSVSSQQASGFLPVRFRKPPVPTSERRARNFFHSLARLQDVLCHRSGSHSKRYAAASLVSAMFDGLGPGVLHYQQDPDELFLYITNLLSKTWNLHTSPFFPYNGIGDYYRHDAPVVQIAISSARPHIENAPPSDVFRPWLSQPFQGLLYQDLLCVVCRKSRVQPLECFNSLSVSFPASRIRGEVFTLENLIKKYFFPDDLDAVECSHCGTTRPDGGIKHSLTPHLKRTSIARFPKILCIHIRRTVWDGTNPWKRRDPINFSATAFMNDFFWAKHVGVNGSAGTAVKASSNNKSHGATNGLTQDSSRTQFKGVYMLKSVIVHVGESSSRGHIVAYRKGPVGSRNADVWYYTSDDVVRQTTWNEVENADPYMLFYELTR